MPATPADPMAFGSRSLRAASADGPISQMAAVADVHPTNSQRLTQRHGSGAILLPVRCGLLSGSRS